VANQIIVALTIEAVGEALVFASQAGADPVKVPGADGRLRSSRTEVLASMIKRTFDQLASGASKGLRGLSGRLTHCTNTTTQQLFSACCAVGRDGPLGHGQGSRSSPITRGLGTRTPAPDVR
jgi:2-hydroxy-3-oxopropionate reductase